MNSAITPSQSQKPIAARSHVRVALIAFGSLLRRDITVTIRQFVAFLIQVVLQPLFLLFIFGKVLPSMGATQTAFGAILLPGIVAFTIFLAAIQGLTLPLVLELGYSREIDDRLLAPLPISMVALEKVLMAALQGLIAGVLIFPLAWWILGDAYQVRTDMLGLLILLMILVALMGSLFGLVMGTVVQPEQVSVIFALVFTPLIFTGCVYTPWGAITLKWFQILTLFNPLTYASEGLRYAMLPTLHGQTLPTLAIGWVLLALVGSCLVFLFFGVRLFRKRVVS